MLSQLTSSCYYDNREDLYKNFTPSSCNTDSITYDSEVQVIVQQNCALSGCHLAPNPQAGLDLSNFNVVKNIAGSGKLVGRITATSGTIMPPTGALPPCEINKIIAWVNDGAPKN